MATVDWIIVVDDDIANLQMAGRILSKNNKRVTALKSGQALLDYTKGNRPDLILLDIKMPVMDGFETLKKLRAQEQELGQEQIPVMFLTADEDTATESRGFEVGVSDFLRKPFDPDVLIRRINNIVSKNETMQNLIEEATIDKLTGFLNKAAVGKKMPDACKRLTGCLMILDLDSFKLVNDIYGHDMGDKVLQSISRIISENMPEGSVLGRIGGDEFLAFGNGVTQEETVADICKKLNENIFSDAKKLMGEEMDIPLGVSIGAVFVPEFGREYETLFINADKALYSAKNSGKHGYVLHSTDVYLDDIGSEKEMDISTISKLMEERNIADAAYKLDKESFAYVYQYVTRYIIRNNKSACKVLFTLSPSDGVSDEEFVKNADLFGDYVMNELRKSDFLMRYRQNQYFVFLTDILEDYIENVIGNIVSKWHENHENVLSIAVEAEHVGKESLKKKNDIPWVIIVDDDVSNLKIAGHVLSKNGMRVTALKSGQALLDYVTNDRPDLILLDIKMPVMDGFETLEKLHTMEGDLADIPVIFLTADESEESESRGLALGAVDFIKKPFVPEVLAMRVSHMVELVALQKDLSHEVAKKTKENENLFIHVVESLAEAIDAKDTYTNGHSTRVAHYSKMIAQRAGYSEKQADDIYIMGLLHDVGKIGIPDEVINKPGKLTEEEFETIKTHPVVGAKILENITEMPKLAVGAKYHHERFGGGGYPEGLIAENIPEEARIIALADAYDAMSSRRSYRDILPQEAVREQIEINKGIQFDPVFADIVIDMIDEDTNYQMKEM